MYNKPLENIQDEKSQFKNEDSFLNYKNSYGYNDNLTSKLGGNYIKIIEFYDGKL
ncbi:hypothetical protein SAMN05428976_102228 [Clostridium sp. USBA 49]|jgi:hypothetical protein|uniref:hypothetical protein n=1 Tax=Clostridium sp. USBA 49 TaxID=1881060 RepID=UPI0009CF408A|nr:hypothetical protein [Clostridium sp. USBA 49]SKA76146.1 hypothetical protein SAMN05428976_102228 [Clostridium sp. USBA 49]